MKTVRCPKCKGKGNLPDPKDQGSVMRKRRKGLGISVRMMAKAMGISAAYLSDLENGKRRWTDRLLLKFRAILYAANR